MTATPRKVTITLEDTNLEEGTVNITVAFDPAVNAGDTATPATGLALRVFEAIKRPGKGKDGYTVSSSDEQAEEVES